MIALFASAVVVGTWWLVVSYAMRHFKLLWQITLVSLVSFVVYTAIEVIGAIRMDPQFVLGSFINRKLLMTAAVRGIGVAALFGIF